MTSPLCIIRGIWTSLKCGALVSGHHYVEQVPEPGQPKCVQVLKCETCADVSVSWSECAKCGAK